MQTGDEDKRCSDCGKLDPHPVNMINEFELNINNDVFFDWYCPKCYKEILRQKALPK